MLKDDDRLTLALISISLIGSAVADVVLKSPMMVQRIFSFIVFIVTEIQIDSTN